MLFFIGLHIPFHASHFQRCMVSVNRLRNRRGPFPARDWVMDSGAFTELDRFHDYRHGPEEYADQVERWARMPGAGRLLWCSPQDYMCEPFMLAKTGGTVESHQARTLERYLALRALVRSTYVLPVLQGWEPADYARHVRAYGSLLGHRAWVGVGSVCKRNARPAAVQAVLRAILTERPDLRLHGYGLKVKSATHPEIRPLLYSSDSMAWSQRARKKGRSGNDVREAIAYAAQVEGLLVSPGPSQLAMTL